MQSLNTSSKSYQILDARGFIPYPSLTAIVFQRKPDRIRFSALASRIASWLLDFGMGIGSAIQERLQGLRAAQHSAGWWHGQGLGIG